MSFKLVDTGEFGISVSGQDLMIGADGLHSCAVVENAKSLAPSVSMTFLDTRLYASSQGLFQDGAPIVLTFGDGTQQAVTYNFNQWSIEDTTANAAGHPTTLHGVANVVPWMSKVITKAYKGNASDVASQLAGEAGITLTDVDPTQDTMTWLPDGRAIGQFIRNLTDRAWMGSGSCPHMAVTNQNGQWMMRMKNIMQSSTGSSVNLCSPSLASPSDIIVWDHRIASRGGSLNTFVNYGHKVVQEKLDGTVSVFQPFDVTKLTSFMGISSALQGAVSLARTFYHPQDVGNTHDNYAQALHNNKMARATFSTTVEVMTNTMSQFKLLDDVQLNLAKTDGSQDTAYSGTYKVSALTRYMSRGHYREKIQLSSQGSGADAGSVGL